MTGGPADDPSAEEDPSSGALWGERERGAPAPIETNRHRPGSLMAT